MKINKILLSTITISVLSSSTLLALDIDGFNIENIKNENDKKEKSISTNKKKVETIVEKRNSYSNVTRSEMKLLQERLIYLEEKLIEFSENNDKLSKLDKISNDLEKVKRKISYNSDNKGLKETLLLEVDKKNKEQVKKIDELTGFSETNSEDLYEMEQEISTLKENLKYQVFKISALEDASFDLEDKIEEKFDNQIQWRGDFTTMFGSGYNQGKHIDEITKQLQNLYSIPGSTQKISKERASKIAGVWNSENQTSVNMVGKLIAYQQVSKEIKWLFQQELTYIDYIGTDINSITRINSDYIERGYMQYEFNNLLKVKVGKMWTKNTVYSDKQFVSERDPSREPLYTGLFSPLTTVGIEAYGSTNVKNILIDYNLQFGEANKQRMPEENKLYSGRIRVELPFLDFTRISSSIGYLEENRNSEVLNNYYNKFVYSFGIEQKYKQFRWSADFIGANYSAQQATDISGITELTDHTKIAFNLIGAYDYDDKWTIWGMYDYLDQQYQYAIDTVSLGATEYMSDYELFQQVEVPVEHRYGIGVNYHLTNNTMVKFEQYISTYQGSSSQITLNAKF